MTRTRRQALQHGLAAGLLGSSSLLLPAIARADGRPAFQATTVADTVRALGGRGWTESKDVTVQGPEIAENGASVPVGIATTLSGIRQLALLVEKNPNTLSAVFAVSDAVEANFGLRIKMQETSPVYAVAIAQDGRAFYARREIRVTLGGCGV